MVKTKGIVKNLLLAAAPIFLYNFGNFVFAVFFYGIFPEDFAHSNYYMMDSMFCFLMMIVFSVWYFRLVRGRENPVKRGTKVPHMALRVPIIVLGMGGISSIWFIIADVLMQSVPMIEESLQSFDETWSTIGTEPYLFVLLSVVILGPIVEELMFRGVMFRYLEKLKPGWFPVVVTGVCFGLWHGEPVQVVYAVMLGLIMGAVYLVVRDLRVTIVIHILNNLLSTLPPAIDTPIVQSVIYYTSLIMIIPALYVLARMLKQYRATAALQEAAKEE